MTALTEQAWENLRAMAGEAGLRGQAIRLEKMNMPATVAEGILVNARDMANPFSFINACIARWRAEQE